MNKWLGIGIAAIIAAGCGGGDSDTKDTTDTTTTTDTSTDTMTDTMTDTVTDTNTDTTGGTTSLFDQLGGETAIKAVIAEFLVVVGGDARINWFFANTDLTALGDLLYLQLCEAAGGPCTYTGLDMVTAHADMAITDAQFDAMIEDMGVALTNLGITYATGPVAEVVTLLTGMRGDIVTDANGDTVYFNQLGGHDAVIASVNAILARVGADPKINGWFAQTDLVALGGLLVEQVCEATGGYCTYSGASMADAHASLGICPGAFDAFMTDVVLGLGDVGVTVSPKLDGSGTGDALVMVLAGMETDIVTNPKPTCAPP